MARSKHTRTLQHFTAMQLILSMQETVGGAITYPNIEYVVEKDLAARMVPEADIKHGLTLMRDLLTLVDPAVYDAFRQALTSNTQVGDVPLNQATMKDSVHTSMAFLQRISSRVEAEMWQDPPHPCTFVIREVVAELLA